MKKQMRTVLSRQSAREFLNVWLNGDVMCNMSVSRGAGSEVVIIISYNVETDCVKNLRQCVSQWQELKNR